MPRAAALTIPPMDKITESTYEWFQRNLNPGQQLAFIGYAAVRLGHTIAQPAPVSIVEGAKTRKPMAASTRRKLSLAAKRRHDANRALPAKRGPKTMTAGAGGE